MFLTRPRHTSLSAARSFHTVTKSGSYSLAPSDGCHRRVKRDGSSEGPDLDVHMETDVIPDLLTGGGPAAAKGGQRDVACRPRNHMLERSSSKKWPGVTRGAANKLTVIVPDVDLCVC